MCFPTFRVTTLAVVLQIQLKKLTAGKSSSYGFTIVFYHPPITRMQLFLGHAETQEDEIT